MIFYSIVDDNAQEFILQGVVSEVFENWIKNSPGIYIISVNMVQRLSDTYLVFFVSNMKN